MHWAKLDHALAASRAHDQDRPMIDTDRTMLDVLQGFVQELRAAGLPVSMTENLDAMRATEHIPFDDRDAFKAALGATLVKHHGHWNAFETVFDVYFSLFSLGVDAESEAGDGSDGERTATASSSARPATAAARWAT